MLKSSMRDKMTTTHRLKAINKGLKGKNNNKKSNVVSNVSANKENCMVVSPTPTFQPSRHWPWKDNETFHAVVKGI